MSDPVDGEHEEATEPASPETGSWTEPSSPEAAVSDAIHEAAVAAEAAPLTEADVADVVIPDAEIPALEMPDFGSLSSELGSLSLSKGPEPVIPPVPADLDAGGTPDAVAPRDERWTGQAAEGLAVPAVVPPAPVTRAERRALPDAPSPPGPDPIPRNPEVVPPAVGDPAGDYRVWTGVIFGILFILLIAAFGTIIVLLTTGQTPFPTAAVQISGWSPPGA